MGVDYSQFISKFIGSIKPITTSAEVFSGKQKDLHELIQHLANSAQETGLGDFKFENGMLSVVDERVSVNEINETIINFMNRDMHPEGIVNHILNFLNNLRKPLQSLISKFLFHILVVLVVHYITAPSLIEKMAAENRRAIINEIKRTPKHQVKIENWSNYRFVIANRLNVRQNPNTKSPIIDELFLGEVVRIIEKRKNWTLVEYKQEISQKEIRGWVFTRYIRKFQPRS